MSFKVLFFFPSIHFTSYNLFVKNSGLLTCSVFPSIDLLIAYLQCSFHAPVSSDKLSAESRFWFKLRFDAFHKSIGNIGKSIYSKHVISASLSFCDHSRY